MDKLILYNKFLSLPEHLRKEAADFIDFLLSKKEEALSGNKARFGSAKGMFKMSRDFDDPIDDFKAYL